MLLDRLIDGLAITLLHSLWQGAAAALVYFTLTQLVRSSARSRFALGATCLVALPLAFALTLFVAFEGAAATAPDAIGNGSQVDSVAILGVTAATVGETQWAAPTSTWPAWTRLALTSIWLVGLALMAIRNVAGVWQLSRAMRLAPALPAQWALRAQQIRRRLGISRWVQFRSSETGTVPYVFGLLRPVVVLPVAMLVGMPAPWVELLIVHELIHVKRWDTLTTVVQRFIETLLFFHPAVWWLSHRVSAEREQACDEHVVSSGASPTQYARSLLELEGMRDRITTPNPALAVGANGGDLSMRIHAILHHPTGSRSWARIVGGFCSLGLVAVVAACAIDPSVAERSFDEARSPVQGEEHGGVSALDVAWMPAVVSRHSALIDETARTHDVDPRIVALMVLVESVGNPEAVSPTGARGLLQLMPATARLVAERHGLPQPTDRELLEPARNLDLGVRLLRELLDTPGEPSDGRLEIAWLTYNAGAKAVRLHQEEGAALPTEARRYADRLLGLWQDRASDSSPAFDAWRARAHAAWAKSARHPLPGANVTSAFGARRAPLPGAAENHEGIDLAHLAGTPVLALRAGTIIEATDAGDARGAYVVIHHGLAMETRYHHLGQIHVREGDSITAGQALGTVGSSGKSTGPHLHLEVRDLGRAIDPEPMLEGLPE